MKKQNITKNLRSLMSEAYLLRNRINFCREDDLFYRSDYRMALILQKEIIKTGDMGKAKRNVVKFISLTIKQMGCTDHFQSPSVKDVFDLIELFSLLESKDTNE